MRIAGRTRGAPSGRACLTVLLLAITLGGLAGFVVGAGPANRDSAAVLLAANRLERLMADLEQSQLRYLATGNTRSLRPWQAARTALPRQAAALQRLAAENGSEQDRRAREIVRAATAYLREHAEPLMTMARRDRHGARALVTHAEGRRRIETIRRKFDHFADVQQRLVRARERDAVPAVRRMTAAAAGVSGCLLLAFLASGLVRRRRGPGTRVGLEWLDLGRLRRTSGEREGLRRLAALAAGKASPEEIAAETARQMGRVLRAEHTMICRYEPDGTVRVTGHWSVPGAPPVMPPAEGHWPVEDDHVTAAVRRTGRPARLHGDRAAAGALGDWLAANEIRRFAGCPILTGERLWGMAAVLFRSPLRRTARAEQTMRQFAALVGVGLENAAHRAELAASRVRLIEAADAARRRIERHLHESTQQRLVAVGLELSAVERTVPAGMEELRGQVSTAARELREVIEGLQDVARQLHPAFLLRRGLEPSLRALARRTPLPVDLEAHGRQPPSWNSAMTVYYVVAEALTNAVLHAHASVVRVRLELEDEVRLRIDDDGVGGAHPYPGSALAHLRDRAEALGGEFTIDSPVGGGTSVRVTIPADSPPAGPASA
ncbi:CHASE3 domain-containing protein [Actinoallomurus sp. NBC_01490]|uniref:CHASE3 domain-containing protein n=1 Tax=Actinoallomurus sp. NBC_01490 TaxID=2903557 RepID=UPI002E34D45E|nr:CHASE3 domain-containing protein [Actinoallomurus sp. NBC_01490]